MISLIPGPSPIAFVTFTTRLNAKHAQEKLKDQPIDPNDNSIQMKIEFAREDTKSENSLKGGEKVERVSNILPGVEKPSEEQVPATIIKSSEEVPSIHLEVKKPYEDYEQPENVEDFEKFQSFYHPYVYPFYHPWFQQMQHDYLLGTGQNLPST